MGTFSASDILEFAMRIEENGARFYRYAVTFMKNTQTKELFEKFAGEEDKHKMLFTQMFRSVEKAALPEKYAGEYAEYLQNYVDNNIVFNGAAIDAEVKGIKDASGAIDFAMKRELDSIAYYQEIKLIVAPSSHPIIDEIIAEERKHFMVLLGIKKTL